MWTGIGLAILAVTICFSGSFSQDIDDIIQFDDDEDRDTQNPLDEQDDNVIHLGELQKVKWKESLRKYDQNKDGKLSGDELLVAYPEIQSLMESDDNDPLWWFTPNTGMVVAVVIGIVTLGCALFKMRHWMSSQDEERSTQHEMNRQEWLNRLEGNRRNPQRRSDGGDGSGDQDLGESSDENERQHRMEMSCSSSPKDSSLTEEFSDSATGMPEDENSSKLQKRKPEVTRDIVTSKMARYQQLSAVRRHPGNQSPKAETRVFQQLLPDEDDVDEMSGDEIVGKTRKRRQKDTGLPADLQEKVARDGDDATSECERGNKFEEEVSTDKIDKSSTEKNDEIPAGMKDRVSLEVKKTGDCKDMNESIRTEEKEDSDFEELYLVSSPLKEKSGGVSTEVLDDSSEPKTVSSESSGFLSESKDFSGDQDKMTTSGAGIKPSVVIETLSHILECSVIVSEVSRPTYTSVNRTLKIPGDTLPVTKDDIVHRVPETLKTMVVRQLDKVAFATVCFQRSEEKWHQHKDGFLRELCAFASSYFIDLIVVEIVKEEDSGFDEDLWSGYFGGSSNETAKVLSCIAGRATNGVFISENLLTRLLQHNNNNKLLRSLLQAAGRQLKAVSRVDDVIAQEGVTLQALEILVENPACGHALKSVLEEEVKEAADTLGNFFENKSIFGSLLSITTAGASLRDPNLKNSPAAIPFLQIRGFPRVTESDVKQLESVIQEAFHRCQNIIFKAVKKVLTAKVSRETGLSWLAAVIIFNDMRTSWSPDPDAQNGICCSDGYMLNFCSVLIELFLPAIYSSDLLAKVDMTYPASEACRLNLDFETCLAGGQIVPQGCIEKEIGLLPLTLQGRFNFLTECYHLTQRALSIGVITTISHYNKLHRQFSQSLEQVQGTPQEEIVKNARVLLTLMWDASLMDPELVRKVSQFYICQSKLLLQLIDNSGKGVNTRRIQKKNLSNIPEFCVRDMAIWFRFVAQHVLYVHKDTLSGISLSPFVDCCVALLSEPELMPGPVSASKVVSALLAFVNTSKRQQMSPGVLGRPILSDLALMVHTCPSVQEELGPALIRTYVSVDVVEGLDVDRDEFDKYSARAEISYLVKELWERIDSRTSILNLSDSKLFQDFLGSILDTLLYMLHDSLARVANVRKLEVTRDNEEEWSRLSFVERVEKEKILKAEEIAAKNFMLMANQTLDFVDLLTKAEKVSACFTRIPLATRSASAISGFLQSLCGTKSKEFKVKDMAKYNFDPQSLLMKIVNVILRIAEQDSSTKEGFVVAMATDADFSPPVLEKTLSVIARKNLVEEDSLNSFQKLIETMNALNQNSRGDNYGARADNSSTQWQDVVDQLKIDQSVLCEEYKAALSDLRFDTVDLQESHCFNGNTQALDPRSAKIKALMKEMKQLRNSLPVHPDAAIFVRQDEERIDLMRAIITGPVDTPYSLGCFTFDIYFPNSYPNIPPLVKIITTGNGTVRFNPNLYSDGKVCLSLLGTWHAGDASEKWSATKSSLYQVLVSIQSLILIPHPMFNEPGYEGLKETKEGQSRSKTYNNNIRLWTVRHAMLGQLRSPPAGFEDLIRKHFTIQKNAILKLCSDWLRECDDEEEERRLRSVVNSLREELEKLSDT
ncbi:uncharacterized protein LOC135464377 [Liolophura sinensis]|uniref:uncharacterized protein LOC135464377 n=1 Tax=Liolophura sinensis TaxID=3198878 RepID=UPI0031582AAD